MATKMHIRSCPAYSSPYATCECERIELREHANQLEQFNNQSREVVNRLRELEVENSELKAERDRLNALIERVRNMANSDDGNYVMISEAIDAKAQGGEQG